MIRPLLFLLVTLLVVGSNSFGQSDTSPSALTSVPKILPEKGYFVQEIRDGLYWVTDGRYNTIFLVSKEGVIAVDPLPTLGPKYLQAIAEVTKQPITHVVYSHEHTDHIGAANLFPKNATYIAQKETAAILARRNDPRRPVPTVTFENNYTLTVGGQTLVLDYKGVNHETGNIFIYAPRQKVLMLVDVIYPGWMPYKNLGIAEDVPGYIQAHHEALSYDFDVFVAGHVNRLGTRQDIETSLEFVSELKTLVSEALQKLDFPSYMRANPSSKHGWVRHNDYEQALVEQCYVQLFPKWSAKVDGADAYLRDNCWAMLESLVVQY